MADEPASPNDWIEKSFARARELEATGLGFGEAFDLAQLERRVDQWPIQWGDDLHVRLFGDFQAPATDIEFKALGIRVSSQKREGTIVYGAYMVLDAVMSTHDKSLTSLLDGIRRLNVLIGAWSLADWGQSTVGWWSHITHGSSGGTIGKLEHEKIEKAAEAALQLSPEVRRKVEAAMYWIRATRHPFQRGPDPIQWTVAVS
jgi:hypothetical protein